MLEVPSHPAQLTLQPPVAVKAPLRVLVYTDSAGVGGAEISLGHLVTHASAEIEMIVVGVAQPVIAAIAAGRPAAQTICLPAKGMPALWAHLRTFHQLRPDIVHINLCTPWEGAIGLLAALTVPQARVLRVDQLPLRTTDLLALLRTRWLSLRLDAHVAVGEACARRLEDFYALGRDSVRSIPNGVPDRFAAELDTAMAWSGSPAGQLQIGSIGRLDAMKGHDVLLRAMAQVDGVKLVILGEGAERSSLEQLAQRLGIADRVAMPGWVEQPQPQQFDAIVQPSRSEGFPLAIVEAMLAARPVVATRVGSVAESIVDGKTGFLIDKNDVPALAAILQRLRDDPALRTRLGEQARQRAAQMFTAEQMTAQYEQLWRKLIASDRSPRLWVKRPKD